MKHFLKYVALGLLAFVVLVAGQVVAQTLLPYASVQTPRSGTYAVFLSNNQVYFGTITSENAQKLTLTDIFYVDPKSTANSTADNGGGSIQLLKLGNELHAPEDWMEIGKNQVLFIEKLKDSGRVVQAIKEYKKK